MDKIKIIAKDWMPEDTFALVNDRITGKYKVGDIVLGKTKKTTWLERKIATYRFKKSIRNWWKGVK